MTTSFTLLTDDYFENNIININVFEDCGFSFKNICQLWSAFIHMNGTPFEVIGPNEKVFIFNILITQRLRLKTRFWLRTWRFGETNVFEFNFLCSSLC